MMDDIRKLLIPLDNLALFWRARANALRTLDANRSKSDPATIEMAKTFDQCAIELQAAMEKGDNADARRS